MLENGAFIPMIGKWVQEYFNILMADFVLSRARPSATGHLTTDCGISGWIELNWPECFLRIPISIDKKLA